MNAQIKLKLITIKESFKVLPFYGPNVIHWSIVILSLSVFLCFRWIAGKIGSNMEAKMASSLTNLSNWCLLHKCFLVVEVPILSYLWDKSRLWFQSFVLFNFYDVDMKSLLCILVHIRQIMWKKWNKLFKWF